jgi:hypothetical protein
MRKFIAVDGVIAKWYIEPNSEGYELIRDDERYFYNQEQFEELVKTTVNIVLEQSITYYLDIIEKSNEMRKA